MKSGMIYVLAMSVPTLVACKIAWWWIVETRAELREMWMEQYRDNLRQNSKDDQRPE